MQWEPDGCQSRDAAGSSFTAQHGSRMAPCHARCGGACRCRREVRWGDAAEEGSGNDAGNADSHARGMLPSGLRPELKLHQDKIISWMVRQSELGDGLEAGKETMVMFTAR